MSTRLGLALSGGGFRAAFFHLGVLAHLAEIGELRRVEVISTVSGGSIIGALYYLHVKNLLQSLPAREIQDAHYVQIVERVQHDFLAGVQKHLRALTFASPRLSIHLEVTREALHGQIVPEQSGEIEFRPAGGASRVITIDEVGWFVVQPVPTGSFRLRCHAADGTAVITDWITI